MEFSIIIPIAPGRNAEIIKCLKNQDYSKKNFEIIVQAGKNPSENRNEGVKKSEGETIIFLDDDAYIEKDYLKNVRKFFKEYPFIDIVGGPQLTPKKSTFFEKISGIALTSYFGAFNVSKRYKQGKIILDADETVLTSANLIVKKNVFQKIKGFDKRLWPGEDPEFIFRAKDNGLKIAYTPNIIIYHKRRPNFSKFCEQVFNYGFTRPQKNKISRKTKIVFLIPMLFLIYFLFLPLFSSINLIFLIPMIAYIFLALIFSLYDSIKNKTFFGFFILPFIYLFLHLSYGIGMITGYVTLKDLKNEN